LQKSHLGAFNFVTSCSVTIGHPEQVGHVHVTTLYINQDYYAPLWK